MLMKDLRAFTREQAESARVVVFRLAATIDWALYVNGELVQNVKGEPRLFARLDAIIAALDAAGIDQFTADIHLGKLGKIQLPETKAFEHVVSTLALLSAPITA